MDIVGTKTEENLKHAIAGEHHVLEKFMRWRSTADVVGPPEVHTLYRLTSMLTNGHAAIKTLYVTTLRETMEWRPEQMRSGYVPPEPSVEFTQTDVEKYLHYADVAATEGLQEIADWFTALADAERSQIPKTV